MNIEKLKQVIQEANPEIMELKFGCEIKVLFDTGNPLPIHKVLGMNDDKTIKTEQYSKLNLQDIKILGRPIRLADVLIAIQKNKEIDRDYEWGVIVSEDENLNGSVEIAHYEGKGFISGVYWNLKDNNLDNQSNETKQFLINLLVK